MGEVAFTSRQDFHDAHADAIDYPNTVALVRKGSLYSKVKRRHVAISPRKFLHMRTLLAGAIYSGERLLKGNQVTNSICPFCQEDIETVEHLLWKCKAWNTHRGRLFRKYSVDFLEQLPTCTRQCGIILLDVLPNHKQRLDFSFILQHTFTEVMEAREKVRATQKQEVDPQPTPITSQHEDPEDIRALNPTAFSRNELFPSYPWDWEHSDNTSTFQKFFNGEVPDNWRRFRGSSEWIYDLDLFPAMVWYFRQLTWPTEVSDYTVTWCELTIDFQAATHTFVQRQVEEIMTLEQQSRLFRAAAKRIGQICAFPVVPDLDHKPLVPVLQSIGLGRAAGLLRRPKLLQPCIVHRVLFAAAMNPNNHKPDHKRSFVPDLSSLPPSIWPGPGRRRLRGKQAAIYDVSLPSKKRVTTSHKDTTQAVVWTDAETQEIQAAHDWRERVRIEKRILHNRTALELNRHVLPVLITNQPIRCLTCNLEVPFPKLSVFMKDHCGGQADRNHPKVAGAARASVQLQQRQEWVRQHNSRLTVNDSKHVFKEPCALDDDLVCSLCNATHPEGWRRFGLLAKRTCCASRTVDT